MFQCTAIVIQIKINIEKIHKNLTKIRGQFSLKEKAYQRSKQSNKNTIDVEIRLALCVTALIQCSDCKDLFGDTEQIQ